MVNQLLLPGIVFDSRLALFIEATSSLVVADLHWGYAESHRAAGNLLPAWGDDEIAATLHALLCDYSPAELIWLGDSLHTSRSAPDARARADAFIAASPCPVHVIAGNHDSHWARAQPGPILRGRLVLHHGDRDLPPDFPLPSDPIEIIGHYHPAFVHRDGAGARLKLPALVQSPTRLILPAFSPWAAGVAWNERLAPGETLWAAAPRRILPIRAAAA
ncbi:MAG: hypothetical protein RLZZ50_1151 [Verrucomicrobiota bacterium]